MTVTPYVPKREEELRRYADVLVKFALGGGSGIKHGDVVFVLANESARPLMLAACRSIIEAGGTYILQFQPAGLSRQTLEIASNEQLVAYHQHYYEGLASQIDHLLRLGSGNPREYEGIDPERITHSHHWYREFMELTQAKEAGGKLTWTGGIYPTPELTAEAGLSLDEYWDQIVRACFLDDADPLERWRATFGELRRRRDALNVLPTEELNVVGAGTDLWVKLGPERRWVTATGQNIPSYEIFTSPDWRGTEGHIQFDQPLYYQGQRIEGIGLIFEKGRVIDAIARTNQALLDQILSQEGARQIGEFSLTDRRVSRIDRFMAHTLYDENRGGRYGNCHIALGDAYPDTHPDHPGVERAVLDACGYNDSQVHVDIISTTQKTVTAHLADGSTRVIYRDGEFAD